MSVESVVWHWLSLTVEDEYSIHDGLRLSVGRSMGMFYADDGFIRLQDLEWIQKFINFLIGLFCRVGMMANVQKSKTTTCHMGEICTGISSEDFSWRSTGEGTTYRECLW